MSENTRDLPSENQVMTFVYNRHGEIPPGITHLLSVHASVRKIAEYAFSDCRLLVDIFLPPTVKMVGNSTFASCTSLVKIRFSNGLRVIDNSAFSNCKSLRRVSLPDTLEYLCNHAFADCESLEVVGLNHGLKEIGWAAFLNCKSLLRVSIPVTVTLIQHGTFENCTSLVDVELHEELTAIADRAFAGCTSICALSIPESCYQIGSQALYGCASLLGVEIAEESSISYCLQACSRLINLSIPLTNGGTESLEPFLYCFALEANNTQQAEILSKIEDRFKDLPVHKGCYHASTTEVADLARQLDTMSDMDKKHKDVYGMTPFHIVATSATLRADILQLLLDNYPLETLAERDANGETIIDYCLLNASMGSVPLIKLLLQTIILEQTSKFGLKNWQSDDLSSTIESLNWNGTFVFRRSCLDKVVGKLAFHLKFQATLLLDLALWKMKLRSSRDSSNGSSNKRYKVDRESVRTTSGAQVVIPSVFGYLCDAGLPDTDVDWSMVPPSVSWMEEQKSALERAIILPPEDV